MADVVENRIVEMEFDNKDFEQGVATSLSTLEKLKEALQFNNSSKGFTELQNSIKSIDFSPIENSLHSLESGFMTLLGSLKRNFFDQISNNIINLGTQLYQNTLGQIKSGGQRRAMNIEQAKFKISGLGEDWDTVYKDMDYAVSGTAYGIDQAANAASQFLASGVKAGDDMKAALRGISGIAAMTSADYDEIANIFTAAAGKGKVQAMELNRISQRGVNAAAAIAQQMGTTEEAVRDMASKGELDFNTFATAMDNAFGEHAKKANETFTGSMSNMKAALSRIGEIFYAPYLEAMIPVFNRLREVIDKFKNAMKAEQNSDKESVATKIADLYKKLSELFIAWTQTWEPRLEKLPKKMEKWFIALDYIGKKVDKFKSTLEDVAKGVKAITKSAEKDLGQLTEQEEQAARDIWILGNWGNGEERRKNLEAAGMSYERVQAVVNQIVEGTYKWDKWLFKLAGVAEDSSEAYEIHNFAVQAILNAYKAFRIVLDTVEAGMQKIFKIGRAVYRGFVTAWSHLSSLTKDIGSPFQEAVQLIRIFVRNFQIAGQRTENIKKTFQGFFAIIKLGSYILASFFKALQDPIRELAQGEGVILKFTGSTGQSIYEWVETIMKSNAIPTVMEKIANAFSWLITKARELTDGKSSLKDIFSGIVEHVKNILSTIKKLLTGETTFSEVFKDILDKVKNFIAGLNGTASDIESPLNNIFTKVKDFVTNIMNLVGTTLFGSDFSFAEWFKKIFSKEDTENEVKESKGIIPTISEKISVVGEQLKGLFETVKKVLSEIGDGISKVWTMLKDQIGNLNKLFTSIFKFVTRMFDLGTQNADGMAQNFQAFADFVSTCFLVARDIVWSIKEPLKEIAKSVADMISGIFNMFAGITNWIGNDPEQAYGAAAFFALLKVIEKIMDYKILSKKGSKDSVLYSIATFFDDMRTAVDQWNKDHLQRVLSAIANAVLKIAIAMALLMAVFSGAALGTSTEDATAIALESFIYVTAFLWEVFAMLAISKNIFSKPMDLTFLSTAFNAISLALMVISIGMAVLMASLKGLSTSTIKTVMFLMMLIIAEVVGGIVLLVYLTTTWNIDEKKLAAVTAFMLAFAKGIKSVMRGISIMMGVVLAMVKAQGDDQNAWDNAIYALIKTTQAAAVLMIALGAAFAIMFITGQNMPDSKNLAMIAVMLIVFTGCIESIMTSLIALIGVMTLADADTVFAALGFVAILAGILTLMIVAVIGMMKLVNNPSELMKGLIGVSLLVLMIGECIKNIAIAGSILAVSGTTASQMEGLVQIVGIIALLVAAMTAIGLLGGGAAGTALVAFAAGVAAIALSIYLISAAIYTIIKAITLLIGTFIALAAVWPQISENVPKMLTDLETSLPKFIDLIGECIIKVATIIIEAAPLIGEAIAIVIATFINAAWGYIPKVVANFLGMIDAILDLLIDGAETILPKSLLLLLMLIEYLDANAVLLGYLLADVLMKVVWGALMALGDFLKDTVIPWLIDFIKSNAAGAKDSLVDAISDAMAGGPVEQEAIQETWQAEINATTNTHMWYKNTRTGEFFETYEEAQNAELDAALAENNSKIENVKGQTIDREVEINTEYSEKAKSYGSFKDTDSYKEITDTTELKSGIGGLWDDLTGFVKSKIGSSKEETNAVAVEAGYENGKSYESGLRESTVDTNAYIKSLQHQSEMAGEVNGGSYKTGFLKGAGSGTEMMEQFMGSDQVAIPEFDTSAKDEYLKSLQNMDANALMNKDFTGTFAINTETDDTYARLNNISDGTTKVQMDTTEMSDVIQTNTDSTKEQISMLDKVKNTLDELKTNLKDCIVMPKGTNIDTTFMLDKQVLGRELTPVVNTINRTNSQKSDRRLASTK